MLWSSPRSSKPLCRVHTARENRTMPATDRGGPSVPFLSGCRRVSYHCQFDFAAPTRSGRSQCRKRGQNYPLPRGPLPMDEPRDFDDILVPTDGSKAARNGAEQAIKFARRNETTRRCTSCTRWTWATPTTSRSQATSHRRDAASRRRVKRSSRRSRTSPLTPGSPATRRSRRTRPSRPSSSTSTEHDIDLVVMGKRGRSDPDKPLGVDHEPGGRLA